MDTSYTLKFYGLEYQLHQAAKYRNRDRNHIRIKIELAHRLVNTHVLGYFEGRKQSSISVVDVGCSIGTFAIEFAKAGYNSYGIDFDENAIKVARQLSREENVNPEFVVGDVSKWKSVFPPIDIAVCFDIFEHLQDDELGAFLMSIKSNLSENGCLVFQTFLTQYDYLLYSRLNLFLIPFSLFSEKIFSRIVKIYSKIVDIIVIIRRGCSYKTRRKDSRHCNPTTKARLEDILDRAGYKVVFMETATLYPYFKSAQKIFSGQSIAHRNLYGVATKK